MTSPTPPAPWILEEKLGRGGQATTWRARHADTGARVALKIFRLADAEDWKAVELFERECAVLQRLDHPGIPRYFAHFVDEANGDLYLATELFPGRPLSERLAAAAAFAPGELPALLRQILGILDYLHRCTPPVVHRDIKPDNLLIDASGHIALVDFGAVKSALTPLGGSTVVGTFGFMAPEQLHGQAGPAADLYSLGVTVAVLATGLAPEALPRRGLALDLPAVLPAGPLRSVLTGLTAPDPDARLPSAAAALAALARAEAPPRARPPDTPALADSSTPAGFGAFVWRLVLFLVWLAATASQTLLGLIEALLPRAHRRKRRRVEADLFHVPRRRDRQLARLDARHAHAMRVVRATRDNLRAVADRSEPYRPLERPVRSPRGGRR